MTDHTDHLNYLVDRLYRYGMARNRNVDTEPREITITDDECLMLLSAIRHTELVDHSLGQPAADLPIGDVLVVETSSGAHCYACGCESDSAIPECPCECHPMPGQRIWVPA